MKITNQKSISELAELGCICMRLGRTQTGMSSYRSPHISFHAFTDLKMNSDRSDFISVADPTRVTFRAGLRPYRSHKKQKTNLRPGP